MTGQDPYREILEDLPLAVILVDLQGKPVFANRAAVALLAGHTAGCPDGCAAAAEAHEQTLQQTGCKVAQPLIERALAGQCSTADDVVLHTCGCDLRLEVWGGPVHGEQGEQQYVVLAFKDNTLLRDLERRATEDCLTGLGNRTALVRDLKAALSRLERHRGLIGVLFLDLDGFKQINDRLGHGAGDLALVQVAQRLRAATRTGELPYRVGGDEFVVVCEHLPQAEHAKRIATRLQRALTRTMEVEGHAVKVTATVGLAVTASPHISIPHLLAMSDADMYRRKRSRGGSRGQQQDHKHL